MSPLPSLLRISLFLNSLLPLQFFFHPASAQRPTVSLDTADGANWYIQLDPSNPDTVKLGKEGRKTAGRIKVPGAWQADGFGLETERMKYQWTGAANYTLEEEIELPSESNLVHYLVVQRAERSVRVICGNKQIAFLRDFLDTLEVDISPCLIDSDSSNPNQDINLRQTARTPVGGDPIIPLSTKPRSLMKLDKVDQPNNLNFAPHPLMKKRLHLTLEVNSTRDITDALSGESELNTAPDHVLLGGWGGLGGHVWIESRSSKGWLVDPFMRPKLAPVPELRDGLVVKNGVRDEDLFSKGLLEISAGLQGNSRLGSANIGSVSESTISSSDIVPTPDLWVKIYLQLDVGKKDGGKWIEVGRSKGACGGSPNGALCKGSLEVEKPKLWSPSSPENQYIARLILAEQGSKGDDNTDKVLDSKEIKIGFKHLEKRVCHLGKGMHGQEEGQKAIAGVSPHLTQELMTATGKNNTLLDSPPPRTPHPEKWGCFYLNNKPHYLYGYGDDSVFPIHVSPPVDYQFYYDRNKKMHNLGFNYVRHHSTFLPVEYFSASCDTGLMIEPEGHIAYTGLQSSDICGENPDTPEAKACDEMALTAWKAAIKSIRNHVCVFSYTMNNESPTTRKWDLFYQAVQELDPDRFFNIDDGVFPGGNGYPAPDGYLPGVPHDKGAFDYWAPQFTDESLVPLVNPNCYRHPGNPPVEYPMISHEMGNVVSFPNVEPLVNKFDEYKANVKIFWLSDMLKNAKIQHGGRMAREFPRWTEISNRKYLLDWKLRIEAVRKATELSGYEWWLGISDYWGGSNGIFDFFAEDKFTQPQLINEIAARNNEIMLLVSEYGDNLPSNTDTDGMFHRFYESNDTLKTSIWMSNRGSSDVFAKSGGVLKWRVEGSRGNNNDKKNNVSYSKTLCKGEQKVLNNKESAGTNSEVAPVKLVDVVCNLPDLGTFLQSPAAPLQLELKVELIAGSASEKDEHSHSVSVGRISSNPICSNSWRSRLYSKYEDGPFSRFNAQAKIFTPVKFCSSLPFNDLVCTDDPVAAGFCNVDKNSDNNSNIRHIYVTDRLSNTGPDAALINCHASMPRGSSAIIFIASDPNMDSGPFFPRFQARFKTQWWMGSDVDRNMGMMFDVGGAGGEDGAAGGKYVVGVDENVNQGGGDDGKEFWKDTFADLFDNDLVDDSWHRLVEGGSAFVLDQFGEKAWPDTVVRVLDSFTAQYGDGKMNIRHSALVWQTELTPENSPADGDKSGGLLIATGLNLLKNQYNPGQSHGDVHWVESAWLLFSMVRSFATAKSLPDPRGIRFSVKYDTGCDGCIPAGGGVVWLKQLAPGGQEQQHQQLMAEKQQLFMAGGDEHKVKVIGIDDKEAVNKKKMPLLSEAGGVGVVEREQETIVV